MSGSEYQVIDIPPGFTHSITNAGTGEMVTLVLVQRDLRSESPGHVLSPGRFRARAAERVAHWRTHEGRNDSRHPA